VALGLAISLRRICGAAERWLKEVAATVRGKVLLAFCALAAITGFLGFSAVNSVNESGGLVVETYDKSLMSISYARLGLSVFTQMQLALAERRSTPDIGEREALNKHIDELSRSLSEDLGVARGRATSERAAIAANDTTYFVAAWDAARRHLITGNDGEVERGELAQRASSVLDAFDNLVEVTAEDGFKDRARALASIENNRRLNISGTMIALFLGVVIAILLTQYMVRPIAAASYAAKRIAEGELDVEITPTGNDEFGLLLKSMALMRDNIRRMMEREIAARRSAQTRLVNAIESSAEAVILVDSEDRILLFNSQVTAFFPNLASNFVVGSLLPAAIHDALTRPTGEICLADGRWLRLTRGAAADGSFVIMGADITSMKERETLLEAAKEDAEAANRSKSQFLANMSHELRTPLNAIIGFSDIIRDAMMGPVSARYKDYAQDIFSSGQHLLSLINEVLDLSKIEVGRFELQEDTVDVAQVIAGCNRLMRPHASEANINLVCKMSAELPFVRADERRLKQIVLNLLSNALKFTPSGGGVTVSAGAQSGGEIVIAVSDTGIGMRPEDVPIALEPFRQLDAGVNRRYAGSGLGLPLAQRLVQMHGGELTIETGLGTGTTVSFTLPAERCIREVASA
jgi:signal transduction histidine kinase